MATDRIPVYYTFGNHQHWVDFHWLWGYYVLPDALADMRVFCDATGAKGCVNFDAIGYEKMAFESPEALQLLREDVQSGRFEIVGASYAQPYGLFHGDESNIRQMIYGVRAIVRMLGVKPKTFWEEEFDFFPQLPQVLSGVGIDKASLYFQWTWHTPEVPKEADPVVWWEGLDGTKLLTATRNRLNLHQWPEDFQILLDELAELGPKGVLEKGIGEGLAEEAFPPLILQWLELMPSPDWMCRSELMIPKMAELGKDERFDVHHVTLGEYLEAVRASGNTVPVRKYEMSDVWHGMSLGKNADFMRRKSRECESQLLTAESLSTMLSLFGRPYAQWDVYPTWELEEAWRELLVGQHHDNDECERLCGYVGEFSYDKSYSLSHHIVARDMKLLAKRVSGEVGDVVAYNPLPWRRDGIVSDELGNEHLALDVPAMGYTVVSPGGDQAVRAGWVLKGTTAMGKLGETEVDVDLSRGNISQIRTKEFPGGLLRPGQPLLVLSEIVAGKPVILGSTEPWSAMVGPSGELVIENPGEQLTYRICIDPVTRAVDIEVVVFDQPKPDSGLNTGLQMRFAFQLEEPKLFADQPLSVTEVKGTSRGLKKYPTGDWMTSPQFFEEVEGALTAMSLVDCVEGDRGILVIHDGSQQWFLDEGGLRNLLNMYDPWDEEHFRADFIAHFRIATHGPLNHADRKRAALDFLRPLESETISIPGGDLPAQFETVSVSGQGVFIGALYRETEHDGLRSESYRGKGVGYPTVLRLVEFNGEQSVVELRIAGEVASAYRTNLLGEDAGPCELVAATGQSTIRVSMKPHEISTLIIDWVPARKQIRDLDSHREVWATVHRVE